MGVPAFIVFAIGLLDPGCDVFEGRAFGVVGIGRRREERPSENRDGPEVERRSFIVRVRLRDSDPDSRSRSESARSWTVDVIVV